MRCNYKYCGGCQAGYDRVAFVKQLERSLPELDFVYYKDEDPQGGTTKNKLLLINGCNASCVAEEECPEGVQCIVINKKDDFRDVEKRLREHYGL